MKTEIKEMKKAYYKKSKKMRNNGASFRDMKKMAISHKKELQKIIELLPSGAVENTY